MPKVEVWVGQADGIGRLVTRTGGRFRVNERRVITAWFRPVLVEKGDRIVVAGPVENDVMQVRAYNNLSNQAQNQDFSWIFLRLGLVSLLGGLGLIITLAVIRGSTYDLFHYSSFSLIGSYFLRIAKVMRDANIKVLGFDKAGQTPLAAP